MTKTYMLAARIGGDHVTDLHLLVCDDHPVDEQFHQLPFLLEGGVGKPRTYPLAEVLYGAGHSGELHALAGLALKLPFLGCQSFPSSFEILAAPLVFLQRDHLPEISLGQPIQLTPEGDPALAEVLLAGPQLLRQPLATVRPT
jgi:hypothetical protein